MKKLILLTAGLLLVFGQSYGNLESQPEKAIPLDGNIIVFSSSDLADLTALWANGYLRTRPGVKIKLVDIDQGPVIEEALSNSAMGFVSDRELLQSNGEKFWKVVVGREVLVPVISKANPFISDLYRKGVKTDEMFKALGETGPGNWGLLLGDANLAPINYYYLEDESVKGALAELVKPGMEMRGGLKANAGDLLNAIRNDPYGLTICKLSDITDSEGNALLEGIVLLPIDKNGNGSLDHFEQIYSDLSSFQRGVGIGKYPHSLISTVYAVAMDKPMDKAQRNFIKWILANGKEGLVAAGFSGLSAGERRSGFEKLYPVDPVTVVEGTSFTGLQRVIMVFILLIVAGILVEGAFLTYKYRRSEINKELAGYAGILNESAVEVQGGLFYDKTHTWAFMEKDGVVKIGIDDFLQHVTGPLTRVKMKEVGSRIKKGDEIFSIIQNGKQLNMYSPVSGTIKQLNKKLIADPYLMNMSPYIDGWVCVIEPSNWLRDIQLLITANKYKEWLKNEFARLKDFLTLAGKPQNPEFAYQVLQDGGEVMEGTLSDLGPEVWDDFQTSFLDASR